MSNQERIKRLEQKLSEAGFKIKYRKRDELVLHKCPLHNDKTPSLTVNTEKGYYRCFSCSDSGSVSKLLGYYGIKYGNYYEVPTIDELEELLNEQNSISDLESSIHVAPRTGENSAKNNQEYKADINELKNYRYYHPYLESRGFTREFVLKNKIGFDPITLRITVPIFFKGQFWGCIKRSVCGDVPKVKYNSNMPKEQLLYLPLSNTNKSEYFMVNEGFADALKASFYGQDSCAIMGCLISEQQMRLVYEQADGRPIIWAMDNDPPGEAGTDRCIKLSPGIDLNKVFVYNGEAKDVGEMSEQDFKYGVENAIDVLDYY